MKHNMKYKYAVWQYNTQINEHQFICFGYYDIHSNCCKYRCTYNDCCKEDYIERIRIN